MPLKVLDRGHDGICLYSFNMSTKCRAFGLLDVPPTVFESGSSDRSSPDGKVTSPKPVAPNKTRARTFYFFSRGEEEWRKGKHNKKKILSDAYSLLSLLTHNHTSFPSASPSPSHPTLFAWFPCRPFINLHPNPRRCLQKTHTPPIPNSRLRILSKHNPSFISLISPHFFCPLHSPPP